MIELYHGTTHVIEKPDCSAGRNNLDFGKGFYMTAMPGQAERWALRLASDRKEKPIVNVYTLYSDMIRLRYRCLVFKEYDSDWLDFIVSSRTGNIPWADYDYIEGGIADDRVIDTVNLYTMGLMTADVALAELSKHRPNNQVCILSQELADSSLKFLKYYVCE